MWIGLLFIALLLLLLFWTLRIWLSNDDKLTTQIFLRCVELNKTFVRQTDVNLSPFDSVAERDLYANQLLVVSAAATLFSVMTFSKSLPHLIDLKFRSYLTPSLFDTYRNLMVAICLSHKLGQTFSLNDVIEFLYAWVLSEYGFTSDECKAFFKFVLTIVKGSIPSNISLNRTKPLSFHI